MVKRLRRRPLTAETGVRFPVVVPKERRQIFSVFFLFTLRVDDNPAVQRGGGNLTPRGSDSLARDLYPFVDLSSTFPLLGEFPRGGAKTVLFKLLCLDRIVFLSL